MGILADILNLIRPPAPAPIVDADAPTPPPATTVEELVAMIGRIAEERGQAEQTIATAHERRSALLLQEGSDREIKRIDSEVDSAHLLLERLDAATPALHERLALLRNDDAQGRWADITVRYLTALAAYAVKVAEVEQAGPKLVDLINEAQRGGFAVEQRTFFPYPMQLRQLDSRAILQIVRSLAITPPPISKPSAKPWAVEFLAWTVVSLGNGFTTAYQMGQVAGFSAEECWAFVDAGQAKFPDPKHIPPKPPAKPKRKS